MENLFLYIVKSSLILSVIFFLYQLLKFDKSFTRNRVVLISGLIISLIMPLLNFSNQGPIGLNQAVLLSTVTISTGELEKAINANLNILSIILIIYLSGVIILLLTRAVQISKLFFIINSSATKEFKGYKLVMLKGSDSPFSFFRYIFINGNISEKDTETIIAHELAHVYQRHSYDIILMEFLVIFQWFNPIVWFYRISLKEVHEYQADRITLNNGIEKAGYIRLLLAMAMDTQPADLTNNFCQIKLKRRLKMITKIRNSRLTGLKFILTIPVMIAFLWVVSCSNSGNSEKGANNSVSPTPGSDAANKNADTVSLKANAPEGNNEVFTVVEDMPKYPGGDEARAKFIVANVKYPQVAKEKGIQGKVFVSFVVEADGKVSEVKVLRGIGGGCDEEAVRVVKLMPNWIPGKQSGKNVRVQFNMPIKFALS